MAIATFLRLFNLVSNLAAVNSFYLVPVYFCMSFYEAAVQCSHHLFIRVIS